MSLSTTSSASMTMTEKIYAAHSKEKNVRSGDIAIIVPDVVLLNDTSGTITTAQLKLMGIKKIANPDQVVIVTDHFYPPKDITSANSVSMLNNLSRDMGIKHLYDSGRGGIEHALLPEIGLIGPGGLVFGADSHTCTAGALNASGMGFGSTDLAALLAAGELWVKVPPAIRIELSGKPKPYVTGKDIILSIIGQIGCDGALNTALEFGGSGLGNLNIDERFAIANMAVEAGAETCVFEFDKQVKDYIERSGWQQHSPVYPDPDAQYQSVIQIALDTLQPVLAAPPSPDNCKPLTELLGTKVDQVYIGNCSNGTMTDLRQAASILRNHDVKAEVRLVIVPATNKIYRQAGQEGLLDIFARAGAFVSMPTCGACFGGHMGILAAGETAVATTNRNFRGRMGHIDSQVFLANAWVAAAAAVRGEIYDPAQLVLEPQL